jgi:hypothetical protein
MERALRFLKSTSVNSGGVGDATGVAEGDAIYGEADATGAGLGTGVLADGECSWALRIESDEIQANKA